LLYSYHLYNHIFLSKIFGGESWQIGVQANGDLFFEDSGLGNGVTLQDGGNVGIGTTTPNVPLSIVRNRINGSTYVQTLMDAVTMSHTAVGSGIVTGYSRGGGATYFGAIGGYANGSVPGMGIWAAPTVSAAGVISTTPNLFVASGGNVAIGTTETTFDSNTGRLNILYTKSANNNSQLSLIDDSAQAAGVGAAVSFSGKYTDAGAYAQGGKIALQKNNSTSGNYGFDLGFYTRTHGSALDQKMVINSSGNVGIGTSSPNGKLEVDVNSASASGLIVSSAALPVVTLANVSNAGRILLQSTAPTNIGILGGPSGTSNYLILTGSAGFGLGDSSPDYRSEIVSSYTNGYFGITNSTDGDIFAVDSSGNVGIGTSTPTTNVKLHVGAGAVNQIPNGGGSNFTPQVSNTQTSGVAGVSVGVSDGTNNRRAGLFVNQTAGLWGLSSTYTTGGIPFVINNAGTEQLRIDTAGNVGIGTTTPASNLQIGNTTSASTASPVEMSLGGTYSSTAGSVSNMKLKLYEETTSNAIGFSVSSARLEYITSSNTYDHVWYGGGTTLMWLDGGTNSLGIGTTTPRASLTVSSSTATGNGKLFSLTSSLGEMFSFFASGKALFGTGTSANCGNAECGLTVATTTQFTAGVVSRVVWYASAASTTINLNTTDVATTTIDRATTFVNPTGTAYDGQMFEIRAKATTTQTVYWGTVFASSTDLTNVSSVASGTTRFLFEYRQDVSKWELVGKLGGYIN